MNIVPEIRNRIIKYIETSFIDQDIYNCEYGATCDASRAEGRKMMLSTVPESSVNVWKVGDMSLNIPRKTIIVLWAEIILPLKQYLTGKSLMLLEIWSKLTLPLRTAVMQSIRRISPIP